MQKLIRFKIRNRHRLDTYCRFVKGEVSREDAYPTFAEMIARSIVNLAIANIGLTLMAEILEKSGILKGGKKHGK